MMFDIHPQRRMPYAALLWSAMLPGFGQMYNRDFAVGAVLLVLEFSTNVLSNLNHAIIESFNFSQGHELTSSHLQWMLFYPGVWSFSMWQAYNKAYEMNNSVAGDGNIDVQFTGLFIGLTVFMQLGVIWPIIHSPVLTGLIFGFFGAIIGNICEKYWNARQTMLRQLHAVELNNDSLFLDSLDAILLTAPDGRIIDANVAACALFGMSCEELIQAGRTGVVDPNDSRLDAAIERRKQNGNAVAELQFIRKDGSKFMGEVVSSLFRAKNGELYSFMIIREVITTACTKVDVPFVKKARIFAFSNKQSSKYKPSKTFMFRSK